MNPDHSKSEHHSLTMSSTVSVLLAAKKRHSCLNALVDMAIMSRCLIATPQPQQPYWSVVLKYYYHFDDNYQLCLQLLLPLSHIPCA